MVSAGGVAARHVKQKMQVKNRVFTVGICGCIRNEILEKRKTRLSKPRSSPCCDRESLTAKDAEKCALRSQRKTRMFSAFSERSRRSLRSNALTVRTSITSAG